MTRIFFRPKALAALQTAQENDALRINAAIELLAQGAFPPHTRKLTDVPNGYRIRIGRLRILFILKNGEIDIADIFLKKGKGNYRLR